MSPERTDAGFPLCLEASNELTVSLPTCVCLWQEQNASNTKTLPGEGASKGPVAAMPSPTPRVGRRARASAGCLSPHLTPGLWAWQPRWQTAARGHLHCGLPDFYFPKADDVSVCPHLPP